MAKKKKKKQMGGPAGKPAFSEPRVQVFSKFAGCNFQLSNRDFDNILNTDGEAQTDLMPMLMAVQNNASVVPMGGIETRQNIEKLFDVPGGKKFTGVATLVGDRMFAALNDMTVRHGTLDNGTLDGKVLITDYNNSYGVPSQFSYSGTVD